jgi:hypothetical protein
MGCACGKPIPPSVEGETTKSSSRQRVAVGRPLGGEAVSGERRALQLAAAEKRAEEHAHRGLQPSRKSKKADYAGTTPGRLELLGRVKDEYMRHGQEEPFGLNLASEEQLQRHLEALRGPNSVH